MICMYNIKPTVHLAKLSVYGAGLSGKKLKCFAVLDWLSDSKFSSFPTPHQSPADTELNSPVSRLMQCSSFMYFPAVILDSLS